MRLFQWLQARKLFLKTFQGNKRSHPKVHCPVTARSKKKIKAFSVSSRERQQKCAKILKNLEFQHRRPMNMDCSKDLMIDYSHMISLFDHSKQEKPNNSHIYESSTSFLSTGNSNQIKDFSIRSNNHNFENSEAHLGFRLQTNMSKVKSAGPSPASSPTRPGCNPIMTPSKGVVSSLIEFNTPWNPKPLNVTELKSPERLNAISVPRQRNRLTSEVADKRSSAGKIDARLRNLKIHNSTLNKELIKSINFNNDPLSDSQKEIERSAKQALKLSRLPNNDILRKHLPKLKFKLPELNSLLRSSNSEIKEKNAKMNFIRKKLSVQNSSGIPDWFLTNKNPLNSVKNSLLESPFLPVKVKHENKNSGYKSSKFRLNTRRNSKNLPLPSGDYNFFNKDSYIEGSTGDYESTGKFRQTAYFPQSSE